MARGTTIRGSKSGGKGRRPGRPKVRAKGPRPLGNSAGVAESAKAALDDLDRTIIRMLQEDGRTAFTSIAEVTGVAEGTIRNRVARLIDAKVLRIIGIADPMALGYDAYAMVGLKIGPGGDPEKTALRFRDRPEVTYVLFVAGHFDLLMEVVCETHNELRDFLRRHCYGRRDIAVVEPMIGLAMYKSLLKWGQL